MKNILLLLLCTYYTPLLAMADEQSSSKDKDRLATNQTLAKPIAKLTGTTIGRSDLIKHIQSSMDEHQIPGLSMAIINNGELVFSLNAGFADLANKTKVTDSTIFEAASLSKPLFGFFVMAFVESGQLDLDQPLYQYLPYKDLKHDQRYQKITARMVLSHTSGMPNWRNENADNKLSINFQPGTAFSYSGEGYQYLALVLAHIAKTDANGLETMFQKMMAQPLGLFNTTFMPDAKIRAQRAMPHDKGEVIDFEKNPKEFGAAYAVHSHAGDYAQWLKALMQEKLLNKNSYEHYFSGQKVKLEADDPRVALGLTDWALGFAVYQLPAGKIYVHGGNNPGFSSIMMLNREQQWGLVVFTNANQATEFLLNLARFLM